MSRNAEAALLDLLPVDAVLMTQIALAERVRVLTTALR